MKVLLLAGLFAGSLTAAEFHIAPTGKDANAGTSASPFATLERARSAVRAWAKGDRRDGATVWIQDGVYPRERTFELTAEDSGTAGAPVVWRAAKDGAARLEARRRIDANAFQKITDPALLARLPAEARGQVWTLDLARTGVLRAKRPPDIFDDAGGLFDLYCNGGRQPLSRWPNETKATMARVLDRGSGRRASGERGALLSSAATGQRGGQRPPGPASSGLPGFGGWLGSGMWSACGSSMWRRKASSSPSRSVAASARNTPARKARAPSRGSR